MADKPYTHIGKPGGPLHAAAWDERYRQNDTPWDKGEPSPGLVDFLERRAYPAGTVLVPGCGVGHDCLALARHGFVVTGIDVSAAGLAKAQQHPRVRYLKGDCLQPSPELVGSFDWVFEHTCFCAIHPDQRDDYVRAMHVALQPGGFLLGIFFVITAEEGPPFGATREELCDRFSPHFTLVEEQTPRSWPNRQGEELLMLWRKHVPA